MALSPGAWLNHYEVLGHLGTGGMGEVYRARDNKLQREVALKILPKIFAQDPERVARFRREAQVLAQVNHVNIAAIYSVEESDGTHFLVMELAQGETLRDRIKKGPVPLEESLDITKQIATGLEAAHEKPIVHRDLKPANVKVTPEGVVKILDFGLARAFAGDTGSGDPADSPTLTGMTQPGTILGTAAYMSPKQARGRKVDKHTDIWALGCVLYELLTAKWIFQRPHQSPDRKRGANQVLSPSPAHPGAPSDVPSDTVADILGAVIHKDPDWSSLPATTPPNVRFVLRRCLEKDAKRRFHAATDVAIALEEPWTVPASEVPAPTVIPPRPPWRSAPMLGLVALVLIALTTATVWNLRPAPPPQPVSRLVIPLSASEQIVGTLFAYTNPMVALSPDGTHLAYLGGSVRGQYQLYLRAMDSLEARPIPGTEGALNPFFSPDGQWIGFFAGGALKKVSTSGGGTLTLAEATNPCGAAWGPNDTIVFAPSVGRGLFEVSAAGGAPQELTRLKEGEGSHRWPQFLPDGKTLLFTVTSGANIDEIAAQRLDTGEQRVLIRGAGWDASRDNRRFHRGPARRA